MSTPNEPDRDQKPDTSSGMGPGAAANGNPPATRPGPDKSGPEKGGLVPPWQRGPAGGSSAPGAPNANGSGSPSTPPRPAPGPAQGQPVNGTGGPPPRGIVTSSPPVAGSGRPGPGNAPSSAAAEQQGGGTATVTDTKFVESPTRTISRGSLPTENLPNLDAIHHVDEPTVPAAIVGDAAVATGPRSAPVQVGGAQPLRAAVQIRRIDPWATFKISAVLAVAGFFIWMISVAVLYLILDGMGVWDQVNSSFGTLVTSDGSSGEGDIIGAGTIFGYAILLGAVNAILLTALATVGAYIYNLCADLIGGAEITLADLD